MRFSVVDGRQILFGYGFALTAAMLYGCSSVIAKVAIDATQISPVVFTCCSLFLGSVMVFLIAYRDIQPHENIPYRYFLFMMTAGVFSACAVTFLVLAVNRAPVSLATSLASLYPLVALSLSHVFLQRLERITMRIVWGTFLAVLGVVLVIIGSTQL